MSDDVKLSKYAAKKARQEKTGEVGYMTADAPSVTVSPSVDRTAELKTHLGGFADTMERAVDELLSASASLAKCDGMGKGFVKGDVISITGMFGVSLEKAKSALHRTRMLLAVMEVSQ